MVDQAARDISSLGMNIANFAQSMKRTELMKSEEERKTILFKQQQKEREDRIMARKEIGETWAGLIDPNDESGTKLSQEGLSVIADPGSGSSEEWNSFLKSKGDKAYLYAEEASKFTSNILNNEQNMGQMHTLAMKQAHDTYTNVIQPNVQAAKIAATRGDPKKAATHIAAAMQGANHRIHAKANGENIEYWEVVNGKRQPSKTISFNEGLALADQYTDENYVNEGAQNIVAGWKSNEDPKTFNLISPDKKPITARQKFNNDGTVEYTFFNKSGSVMDNPPADLEQAYLGGWKDQESLESVKTRKEIEYKEAQTAKLKKETTEISKGKTGKDDLHKYGKDRYKALTDAKTAFDESIDENKGDWQTYKEKVLIEYNKVNHGWEPHSKTPNGELLWYTGKGNEVVDDYGRKVEIKERPKDDGMVASHKTSTNAKTGKKITPKEKSDLNKVTKKLPPDKKESHTQLLAAAKQLALRKWQYQDKSKKAAQKKALMETAKELGISKEDWKATGRLYKDIGGWLWESYQNVLKALNE